jgi:hypothetical protein
VHEFQLFTLETILNKQRPPGAAEQSTAGTVNFWLKVEPTVGVARVNPAPTRPVLVVGLKLVLPEGLKVPVADEPPSPATNFHWTVTSVPMPQVAADEGAVGKVATPQGFAVVGLVLRGTGLIITAWPRAHATNALRRRSTRIMLFQ